MNWDEFFSMGGYAFYVWVSYLLALLVLSVNALLPLIYRRRFFTRQSARLKREGRR
ncbi:MAG: heme exporter protein CcmD [Gammaproteobacteria bacterium]